MRSLYIGQLFARPELPVMESGLIKIFHHVPNDVVHPDGVEDVARHELGHGNGGVANKWPRLEARGRTEGPTQRPPHAL